MSQNSTAQITHFFKKTPCKILSSRQFNAKFINKENKTTWDLKFS